MLLIQKPITKNDIVTLKLLTGEEVIAIYVEEDAVSVTVSKPSVIGANPSGGMGLLPWIMSAMPNTITINKHTIITYVITDASVAKKFSELTSSIARV